MVLNTQTPASQTIAASNDLSYSIRKEEFYGAHEYFIEECYTKALRRIWDGGPISDG
jgi:hypothetical protein